MKSNGYRLIRKIIENLAAQPFHYWYYLIDNYPVKLNIDIFCSSFVMGTPLNNHLNELY